MWVARSSRPAQKDVGNGTHAIARLPKLWTVRRSLLPKIGGSSSPTGQSVLDPFVRFGDPRLAISEFESGPKGNGWDDNLWTTSLAEIRNQVKLAHEQSCV